MINSTVSGNTGCSSSYGNPGGDIATNGGTLTLPISMISGDTACAGTWDVYRAVASKARLR